MTPTVTQLLDLLNKPALLKWANKIGLEGTSLADHRKKTSGDGTKVHKLIENDLLHGLTWENPAYRSFISTYEVLQVEPVIECEHYHGRGDILLRRNGLTWLFDFKNSDKVYLEQKLQLVAYNRVLKADRIGIVHTSNFVETIVHIEPDKLPYYERILSGLCAIWQAKQILDV